MPKGLHPPSGDPALEAYPNFARAFESYEEQRLELVAKFEAQLTIAIPDGYEPTDGIDFGLRPFQEIAGPFVALPLALQKLGTPIVLAPGLTDWSGTPEEGASVFMPPSMREAYEAIESRLLKSPQSKLAHFIVLGAIDEEAMYPSKILERKNNHLRWGQSQGVLERAFLTSQLARYCRWRRVSEMQDLPIAEEMLSEKAADDEETHMPLALETVRGMGLAVVYATLRESSELRAQLGVDLQKIPTIDLARMRGEPQGMMEET
jgi:hypothetical protein